MEQYKWIIVTVIAYFLALLWDLKKRDKESESSPKRFDIVFYLKDNVWRLIISLFFSTLLALLFWMVFPEFAKVDEELTAYGILVYIVIGAAPDLVVAYAKRKSNFLRVEEVEGYKRKQ